MQKRLFIIGLFTLSLGFLRYSIPSLSIGTTQSVTVGPLSCKEIIKIAKWSFNQYGGPKKIDLSSDEFSKGLTRAYLERLDPYKVLIQSSEVFQFQKDGAKQWHEVVKNADCSFFDQWASVHYSKAKLRFLSEMNHSLFLRSYIALYRFPKKIREERPFKKYPGFAVNENDWKTRVQDFVGVILYNGSKPLLEQYQNQKMDYVRDALEQTLFEEKVDSRQLLAKAVLGAFDSYSTYFSPSEFEDFYVDLSGGTSGVGIRVQKVPQGLLIDKVVQDSPAARSKRIELGDLITAIDGVNIAHLSMNKSKQLLKGDEGTLVRLTIEKSGKKSAEMISVRRERFALEDSKITHKILASKKGSNIAVVGIPSFYGKGGMSQNNVERSSSEDLRSVLENILDKDTRPESIVLDLRGNPGGFLEEAVSMAGMFIGNKPVVGVMENNQTRVLRDNSFQNLYNGPLVILVDEETASAGEVLAGALKDHQRALLVGSKSTYGKGSVQKLSNFKTKSSTLASSMDRATES